MKKKTDKVIKTKIQYSKPLSDADFNQLITMQETYRKIKSFTYHKLRNIKNFDNLNFRNIRKEWIKNGIFEQWTLPAHLKAMAVDDAIGQIKSKHSNLKIKIKQLSRENENHSKDDEHYIAFIVSKDNLWFKVLNNKPLSETDYWKNKDKFSILNIKKLNNYIKRQTRKFNTKMVAKSDKTMIYDSTLYKASKGEIKLASLIPRKRIIANLTDNSIPTGNITIVLDRDKQRIEIHSTIEVNKIDNHNDNIIGVDKGFTDLLATSSGNIYGEKVSIHIKNKSDYLSEKYKKRNKLFQIALKHKENDNLRKYNNIIKNNLGKIKMNRKKNKFNERIKSELNYSINNMIKKEKPKEIILENLNFVSKNKKYGKKINRYLSAWQKGYLQKQLEHKSNLNNIKITLINPAYTSQVCSNCGAFGSRNGKDFICEKHGTVDADINASLNILLRKYIKDISLFTPYKRVKIKLKRLAEAFSLYSVSTKTDISMVDFIRANY